MIAALYVDPTGPYWNRPDVDAWDRERDARLYAGPYPVVAHPPCAAWGRFHYRARQDERELAILAVQQVQQFGGVLEHPSGSRLWDYCELPPPLVVDQVWWGHRARKRTWLYFVRCAPLPLPSSGRIPTHCIESSKPGHLPAIPKRERHLTPVDFAEWLIGSACAAAR